MSHGHGWKNQSTFPLTAAMTEGKPFQQQVEAPAAGEGSAATAAPDSINETIIQTKKKRGETANPLAELSSDEVLAHAQAFAEANNLPVEYLRKGALVAKSPNEFEHLSILSDEDKFELRREKERKFWQPKTFYNLVIACSVAAAVQGMDESVISGAQLFYPKQLGIDGAESEHNRWLNGLVNAAPYLCCGVLGCWLTDPLNKFFGRRGTIMFCSVVSIICCIWQACTNTWWHLFIARFILGIGIGPNSSTVPIFSAECAPAPIRGALVMQWQVWTAFGIVSGTTLGAQRSSADTHPRCSDTSPTWPSSTSLASLTSPASTGVSCSLRRSSPPSSFLSRCPSSPSPPVGSCPRASTRRPTVP